MSDEDSEFEEGEKFSENEEDVNNEDTREKYIYDDEMNAEEASFLEGYNSEEESQEIESEE